MCRVGWRQTTGFMKKIKGFHVLDNQEPEEEQASDIHPWERELIAFAQQFEPVNSFGETGDFFTTNHLYDLAYENYPSDTYEPEHVSEVFSDAGFKKVFNTQLGGSYWLLKRKN